MDNIWNNSFYADFKPIPKWAFTMAFDVSELLTEIDAANFEKIKDILNKAITSINYGKREVSVINTFFGGVQANFPGRVQNTGELTITFNENSKYDVTNILETIFRNTSHDELYFRDSSLNGYRRGNQKTTSQPMIIEIFDPNVNNARDKWIAHYEFYNVFLIAINEDSVDYSSEDEIITRTARFSYDYMFMRSPNELVGLHKEELEAAAREEAERQRIIEEHNSKLQNAIEAYREDNKKKHDELVNENDFMTQDELEAEQAKLDAMKDVYLAAGLSEQEADNLVQMAKDDLAQQNEWAKDASSNEFKKMQDDLEQDVKKQRELALADDGVIDELEAAGIKDAETMLDNVKNASEKFKKGEKISWETDVTGLDGQNSIDDLKKKSDELKAKKAENDEFLSNFADKYLNEDGSMKSAKQLKAEGIKAASKEDIRKAQEIVGISKTTGKWKSVSQSKFKDYKTGVDGIGYSDDDFASAGQTTEGNNQYWDEFTGLMAEHNANISQAYKTEQGQAYLAEQEEPVAELTRGPTTFGNETGGAAAAESGNAAAAGAGAGSSQGGGMTYRVYGSDGEVYEGTSLEQAQQQKDYYDNTWLNNFLTENVNEKGQLKKPKSVKAEDIRRAQTIMGVQATGNWRTKTTATAQQYVNDASWMNTQGQREIEADIEFRAAERFSEELEGKM